MTAQPLLEYRDPDFLELNPHLANTGIGSIGRKIDPHTSTGVQLIKELITTYTSQPFTPGRPPYLNAIVLASDVMDEPESPSLEQQKKIVAVCRIPGFDCVPPPSRLASQSNGADATTGQTADFGFIYNNPRIKGETEASWNEIFSHTLYFQRGNLSDNEYSRIVPGAIVKVTFADFEYKTRPEIIGINNLTGYTLPLAAPSAADKAMAPSEPYSAPTPIQIPISPLQTTEAYDYPVPTLRPYETSPDWQPGYCAWANPAFLGVLDMTYTWSEIPEFKVGGRSYKKDPTSHPTGRKENWRAGTSTRRDGYDIIILHDGGYGHQKAYQSSKGQPRAVWQCAMGWREKGGVSSHYYITFDGTLYVLADESMKAKHVKGYAGNDKVGKDLPQTWVIAQSITKKSVWKHSRPQYQREANSRSIAIDFQSAWSGLPSSKEYGLGRSPEYPPYSKAQVETCIKLIKDISYRRQIPIDDNHVLAHFELTKTGKDDPWPHSNLWTRLQEEFEGIKYDHRQKNWNHPATTPPPDFNDPTVQGTKAGELRSRPRWKRASPKWRSCGESTDAANRLKSFNPFCFSVREGWRKYDEAGNNMLMNDPYWQELEGYVESSPPPAPPRFGKSVDM